METGRIEEIGDLEGKIGCWVSLCSTQPASSVVTIET